MVTHPQSSIEMGEQFGLNTTAQMPAKKYYNISVCKNRQRRWRQQQQQQTKAQWRSHLKGKGGKRSSSKNNPANKLFFEKSLELNVITVWY